MQIDVSFLNVPQSGSVVDNNALAESFDMKSV